MPACCRNGHAQTDGEVQYTRVASLLQRLAYGTESLVEHHKSTREYRFCKASVIASLLSRPPSHTLEYHHAAEACRISLVWDSTWSHLGTLWRTSSHNLRTTLDPGAGLYRLSPTETRRRVSFVHSFEETTLRVASTSITGAASLLFWLPSTHCECHHADEACRVNLVWGANGPNSGPSGRHVYGISELLLIQVHACAAVA